MIYENWLFTGSLAIESKTCPPLKENIKTDCLVIGGGFAGLHAALRLIDSGKKVILLEKGICGSSSSGQSGGFLTPESEEDIKRLIDKYGKEKAEVIYKIPKQGVELIVGIAKKYKFNCDLRKQDSIYLSIKKRHDKSINEEKEARGEMGLDYQLLDSKELKKFHPGRGYTLGLKYPGSYGINSFAYTQEIKNLLLKKGVKIFEGSEVNKIQGDTAITHLGSVTAKNIIVCIDKMKNEFNEDLSKEYYHIQTYLTVSEPLTKKEVKSIFPSEELMCWDTRLIYGHYRLVENNRLLVGFSTPSLTYSPEIRHTPSAINLIIKELKWRFPQLKDVKFPYYWSGLIDVTRDLTPIADYDLKNKSIQYTMGCAGLPWAAYCGDYLARRVINKKETEDLSEFLGINRKYFLPKFFQKIFGKKITFAISHIKQIFS